MSLKDLFFNNTETKEAVFRKVEDELKSEGFDITEIDNQRPWGGFFRISDAQIEKFIELYFPDANITDKNLNLSPKFMIWAPGGRLSWQVHARRTELWKVVKGSAGAYLSPTDGQPLEPQVFQEGDTIDIPQGTRHRSGGLLNWAIIAEIWVHTDPHNTSDENDIRRIEDDYGRKS